MPAIVATGSRPGAERVGDLIATRPGPAVAAASAAVTGDSIAKILFTSGSTGTPKGVLNTHRMLAANQQMIRQAWPFLRTERPVIVDWLPWSHTFGGNHNVNLTLTAGGTLYVDGGRPAPGMFGQSVANLADVPPTIYFNVPAGYAQLVPALEADAAFAARFFSRLRLMFNAAAALPAALRQRLGDLATQTAGHPVPVTGSWGATETAPAVTSAHYDFADARCIGVPLPGAEVRLVPVEGAYEIRVKGPMVTPGYFGRPDLTAAAFDTRGYYRTGDAVGLADPDDPGAGLVFRGRIAEDFKLSTGTFVRVGAVRTALLSAAPLLADAVIAGENRACVCALAWLNAAEAAKLLGQEPQADGDLVTDETIRAALARALAGHNAAVGSAARVERLLVLARPAGLDAGEITDKGYVNQRQVLANRAALVELLYASRNRSPGEPGIPGRGRRGGKDGMMRQQSMTRPRSLTSQHGGPKATGQARGPSAEPGRGRASAGRRPGAWSLPPRRNRVAVEYDVEVPMSDGTVLLATHYIPVSVASAATVLVRCPYGRTGPFALQTGQILAERGYHVLLQSVRGTFGSGGDFEPMRHEITDGQDTVAWLRQQSWFEGRLATYGPSYLGFVQWALAMDPPPELVAAVVHVGPHDFNRSAYRNGAFDLYNYVMWSDLVAHQESSGMLRAMARMFTAERRLRQVLQRPPGRGPLRRRDRPRAGLVRAMDGPPAGQRPVLGADAVRSRAGADHGPGAAGGRLAGPVHRADPGAVPHAGRPGRARPPARRPLGPPGPHLPGHHRDQREPGLARPLRRPGAQ